MNAEILFFLYSKDNWKKILSSLFEQNSINIALYLKLLKTWTFSNYKINYKLPSLLSTLSLEPVFWHDCILSCRTDLTICSDITHLWLVLHVTWAGVDMSIGDAPQVRQGVTVVVPAPIAEVQTPQEGHLLINGHNLLMVGPEEHSPWPVVWVPKNLNKCNTGKLCHTD